MRAAVIFGLGSSERDLKPFGAAEWQIGVPANTKEAGAVLVFGGDGTIHRHLAQLVRLQLPTLIVPYGSGNDFARALGLKSVRIAVAAWRKFAAGTGCTRTVDLGLITPLAGGAATSQQRYFCCAGGVGLDAEVARRANQLPRWLRGHGGYAVSLPAALFRFAALPMKISVAANGESPGKLTPYSEKPTVLAAFANTPVYGGGMQIAPEAKMDDGQLDLCIVSEMDKFKLFCLFPTVYFGRHLRREEVQYARTPYLRIESERPLDVYADGEYVCQTPIEVQAVAQALRVILP